MIDRRVRPKLNTKAILSLCLSLASLLHVYFMIPSLVLLMMALREAGKTQNQRGISAASWTAGLILGIPLLILMLAGWKAARFEYEASRTKNAVIALNAVREVRTLMVKFYGEKKCFPEKLDELGELAILNKALNSHNFVYVPHLTEGDSIRKTGFCTFALSVTPKAFYKAEGALQLDQTLVITILDISDEGTPILNKLPAPPGWTCCSATQM